MSIWQMTASTMMRDRHLLFYQLPRDRSGFPSNSIPHARKARHQNCQSWHFSFRGVLLRCKEIPSPFTTLHWFPSLGKGKPRSPTDKHGFLLQILNCQYFPDNVFIGVLWDEHSIKASLPRGQMGNMFPVHRIIPHILLSCSPCFCIATLVSINCPDYLFRVSFRVQNLRWRVQNSLRCKKCR